jgi:hypothetical protein
MSAEPNITQAEMDKYFESGGKDAPAALVEAEKVEAEVPETPAEKPIETIEKPVEAAKPVETPKPDGEVQVQVDGKTVPLSELLEERKARQAWQTTAAQQQQQLSEALKLAQQRAQFVPAEEQAKAPDPNVDPAGYAQWEYDQYRKQVAELNQWKQQQQQQLQAVQQTNQVLGWAQQQARAFEATTPDYSKALQFAIEREDREYQALGVSDPAARQQLLEEKQAQLINYARQNNLNPAQLVYNYAKEKGYKLEGVATAKPDLDEKVSRISKGQEAARGVGKSSGGAPTEINSLADLAGAAEDMSDEEFSKAFDKIVPKMKGKYV